jgi:hypothetical protein
VPAIYAQTPDITASTWGFAGLKYTGDSNKIAIGGGFGIKIAETGLWSFTSAEVGNYASVNEELAYLLTPTPKFWIGPFVGAAGTTPNTNIPKPIWYGITATGGVAGYNFTPTWGLDVWAKYKSTFNSSNAFPQGWLFGLNTHFKIKL